MASHHAKLENSERLQSTLRVLKDFGWHTSEEIYQRTKSMAVHSDIHELRKNGLLIDQRYRKGLSPNGRRISEYRLLLMPALVEAA